MISLKNLGMSYGARDLFNGVSLQLNEGVRYGITGANGSGKSTLLKLIAGRDTATEGKVDIQKGTRIAYLEQNLPVGENETAIEIVIGGDAVLAKALKERDSADLDPMHAGEIEEIIRSHDGYRAESESARLLSGLGLPDEIHKIPAKKLSGGQMMRVLLARALFAKGEVLLLDEPTNHLDMPGIKWLENFLLFEFTGMLLLITHDRGFLSALSEQILDVDYKTITLFNMNYNRFVGARTLAAEQKEREAEAAKKKIAELTEFIDRFKAKASKARQAQSRVKQVEKIEIPDIIASSRRKPSFFFRYEREPGRDILNVHDVAMGFGDLKLFAGAEFLLRRGDKAAIIGPNGHGKTTLLKIIAGELKPLAGTVHFGHEVKLGYYAQVHEELRKLSEPMHEHLHQLHAQKAVKDVRTALGHMLFEGDEQKKKLTALSGGEMARYVFADLMLQKPNFLVLDEPTNHLDIEGIEALENALIDFKGTVLMVSHDRSFIKRVCTRVFELKNGSVKELNAGVAAMDDLEGAEQKPVLTQRQKMEAAVETEAKAAAENNLSYEERKRAKSEAGKVQTRIKKLEEAIAAHEASIADLEALFADGARMQALSPEEIRMKSEERAAQQKQLEEKLAEWETLAEANATPA
ncbi:MAG: ABC-F family ATP-binding cassette domain-containing protein [Leptospiraceae bacterium]|nr:ABC-F family ATP-binding cassette domain-containing protein [Leptospiraceae bacterium]